MNYPSPGARLPGQDPAAGMPDGPPRVHRPVYDGRLGELFQIAVSNGLLSLLTLGIYRFWAKTRLRRYLWGHVTFLGDRLEYSGRGIELFIGLLVALLILSPIIGGSIAIDILFVDQPAILAAKGLVQAVLILYLIGVAIYRARRYRLTRTQWRGIRFGQTGSALAYGGLAFGWMLAAFLSFGLAYPVYRQRIQRYRTRHTWFGDRSLEFDARAAELFWPWVLAWILLPFTLGLSYVWYRAREFRYFASKTRYGNLTFRSTLSTAPVIGIYFLYTLAVALLIGLVVGILGGVMPELFAAYEQLATGDGAAFAAGDWAVNLTLIAAIAGVAVLLGVIRVLCLLHPLCRIVCGSVEVAGEEDYAAIAQSQQTMPGRGEGLADALDVGAF